MGVDEIALPAQLVRTSAGDEIRLEDGQVIKLTQPLGGSDSQELMVAIMPKQYYRVEKQALAKQLLQEIIKG